jgi:hypothetical protein
MSIILNKKLVENLLSNIEFDSFNQEYIICKNSKVIYDEANKYCLKRTDITNILNNLIEFENKNKPKFNFDIIDKIKYNNFEYQKLILKWMSYIENNIDRDIIYYPNNINFYGGCIVNNNYNKIWSILSYLVKDNNKTNLIICNDSEVDNIYKFLNLNNQKASLINKETNIFTSFNIVSFEYFRQKICNNITDFNWYSIFITDIHRFDFNFFKLKSKYRWCSSTPFNIINTKNFFNIVNFLCNQNLNNKINYNILNYVIQVLFIYTESSNIYNKNYNYNICKKEITFHFNSFEKHFYNSLVNSNSNFNLIKIFTSYPINNTFFNKLNFNSKLKINNKRCIICYDNKNNVKLDCGHEFCFKCIFNQIMVNPTCPLCRKPINCTEMILKKENIKCLKSTFLKYFIENNKKNKVLIITQFKETEDNIIKFLNYKNSRFLSINKKFKTQINNYNIYVLNYENINYLRQLKNINYILFFEPLYISYYLKDKIESEIIGKISLDNKNQLKIITLGFKNTIDDKFLI